MIGDYFARRWQRAGLIDDAALQRILGWEAAHRRPVWLWAVAGMGALAIAFGAMAIVGANWESIPAWLKLTVDLGLNGVCAATILVLWRRGSVWACDIAALLLFGFVLSGIALIGQVYQLQSDAWHALALWLALCTPFLALVTRTRLVGVLWVAAMVTTWVTAGDAVGASLVRAGLMPSSDGTPDSGYLALVLAYLPPCGVVGIGVLRRRWSPARAQGEAILVLGQMGLMAAASMATALTWLDAISDVRWGPAVTVAAVTAGTAFCLGLERDAGLRRSAWALLAASLIAWVGACLAGRLADTAGDVARALLFIAYWAVIGGVAARGGRRALFGFAFAMVGLRLLVLYLEAIGGLTATGLGLIGGGVLCLVLAAIGWRLVRVVPRRTGAAPS